MRQTFPESVWFAPQMHWTPTDVCSLRWNGKPTRKINKNEIKYEATKRKKKYIQFSKHGVCAHFDPICKNNLRWIPFEIDVRAREQLLTTINSYCVLLAQTESAKLINMPFVTYEMYMRAQRGAIIFHLSVSHGISIKIKTQTTSQKIVQYSVCNGKISVPWTLNTETISMFAI